MLPLDLFELLGRVLVIPPLVEQEDALVVELLRRLVGSDLFLAEQAAEAAAGAERDDQHGHKQQAAPAARATLDRRMKFDATA